MLGYDRFYEKFFKARWQISWCRPPESNSSPYTSEAEVIALSNQDDQDMLTIYLNNNYSTGYDEVQVTIQTCQHLLMKYLKHLVNSILILSIFPNSLRYEKI